MLEKVFIYDNKMIEIINGLLIKLCPFVWGLDRIVQVELNSFFVNNWKKKKKTEKWSHLLMQKFKWLEIMCAPLLLFFNE